MTAEGRNGDPVSTCFAISPVGSLGIASTPQELSLHYLYRYLVLLTSYIQEQTDVALRTFCNSF